ncbi:hypothetical protein B566_EDAN006509 [Ephemera danica]|nr:hypothetical protein B566_EDAN006509 [Ephemera danica]
MEGVLKIQYSGGPGLTAGYCRVASVLLRAEVMPSLQVTRWDVLPAETGSEFYLVLDVVNQAPQEAELHYAPGKSILVEAGEFCRVPVPVPRCPLDKLNKLYEKPEATEQLCSELERVCSEHIAENVALRWVLADGRHGTLKLDGIHCSEQMLDIVRSSPLDWELQVDGTSVGMEEVTCKAGEPISLAVQVRNKLPRALRDLTLALAMYQDHQNGVRNYRLETRLAIAGASSVLFDEHLYSGNT